MKKSLLVLGLLTGLCCQAQESTVPSAFRGIIAAGNSTAIPSLSGTAFSYAARPDFSQPSLSPKGTRLALVSRVPDSVTTLAVLDVSGAQVKPVMRMEVPNMKSVQSYGWANEDKLVVWLNMDTSRSSDDDPSSSLYIAQLDLKTKKITERQQATAMSSDIGTQFPISSELVRAPWRDPNHVLINECKRVGGVKTQQRGEAANYTFAPDPPPSTLINCQLLDWNLENNRASIVAKPIYAYPTRFFANRSGDSLKAEGRKTGGKMVHSTWDVAKKKWLSEPNANPAELQPEWDSSEEDFADLWKKIHQIMPDQLDPAGVVVKTSDLGKPIGIQFSSPEQSFGPLDADVVAPASLLNAAFANAKAFAPVTLTWLGATDDKSVVLFSAEGIDHPGAYFLWKRATNAASLVTNVRSISDKDITATRLETNWLPYDLPVAVTRTPDVKPKGLVLMPVVVSDDAATDKLSTLDLAAQWFAKNGLMVVRVPVGLPAALSESSRGDPWRRQVAQRVGMIAERVRKEVKLSGDDPLCLYGREADGYAALAAAAFGSKLSCVLAVNVRMQPKIFAQPYTQITTTQKTWYLSSSNAELRMWRSLYGADQLAGSPENWPFDSSAKIFLAYEMFDEHRALASFASNFNKHVSKAGGAMTLYTPNLDASKTDQWLANMYETMEKFVLPPEKPGAKKKGVVEVGDVDKGDSKPKP